MKKLLSLMSALTVVLSGTSAIVACEDHLATNPTHVSPEAIGGEKPGSPEGELRYEWLGEIKGNDFDENRARNLWVNAQRKVVIEKVEPEPMQDKLNQQYQGSLTGGYIYESVYILLRNVYGINIINMVDNLENLLIFKVEGTQSHDIFIENNYGSNKVVKTGKYYAYAPESSKIISGKFDFELNLQVNK